jgi:hypothetical protein
MVKVVKKGKAYMLTKEEFRKYMYNLWKTAQSKKQAKEDMRKEGGQ